MFLDPLVKLLRCLRRIFHRFRIIGQDHCGPSVRHHQVVPESGFHLESVYIGDLALIQGNKEILSAFVHVFRHLVAAQLDHIVIRIRLARLFRGYHTLKQPLGSGSRGDKLKLCRILILGCVKLLDLLFKLYPHIIRASSPNGHHRLSGRRSAPRCTGAGGAAGHQHGSHRHSQGHHSSFLSAAYDLTIFHHLSPLF